MHELTNLIREDMKPALGVTEPGAIAYAVATAMSYVKGEPKKIALRLNSGIYKNAFTCGIPNSSHLGNLYAAALGAVAGVAGKGLESLSEVTQKDNERAELLVKEGLVSATMCEVTSRIFIEATVYTSVGEASVTIRDTHTNIVKIVVDGKVIMERESQNQEEADTVPVIHKYSLSEIVSYIEEVPYEEISFIMDAHRMNYKLFELGIHSDRTTYAPFLLAQNGGNIITEDEQKTASLLCNAAIEARVIGLDLPAMSITGSGAHGIIATMPLYAVYKIRRLSEEKLCRATALSYLICMYIKEYSGKLSAFCGCGIAAGSGMALGLLYLWGEGQPAMEKCLNNMASGITGMICDGGNKGCAMKGVVAVDAAFQSARLAMANVYIESEHGINGKSPEDTMRNMGLIASPGMTATEGTIVEIMENK